MDRRLTTVAILLALAAAAAGCASTTRSGGGGQPTAYASPAVQGTNLPTAPSDNDGPGDQSSAAPSTAARDVAVAFARAWARPDLPATLWLAGVRPFTAPTYLPVLATVDPANVPARAVTGPAVALSATPTVNVYSVPTDAVAIQVTCTLLDGRWLVTDVTRPPK